MGFLSKLLSKTADKIDIPSVFPEEAKQLIISGKLPLLQSSKLFEKPGEKIHYIDRAVLIKKNKIKKRVGGTAGYSIPGLLKGSRIHLGGNKGYYVDDYIEEQIKGVLYITNQRIVFVSSQDGFDMMLSSFTAMNYYSDAIELQHGKEIKLLYVPDGRFPHMVVTLIRKNQ